MICLLNYFTIPFAALFFREGGPFVWFGFFIIHVALSILNHIAAHDARDLLRLNLHMLAGGALGHLADAMLYMRFMSDDAVTKSMSFAAGLVGCAVVIVFSLISVAIKYGGE